MKIYNKFTRD